MPMRACDPTNNMGSQRRRWGVPIFTRLLFSHSSKMPSWWNLFEPPLQEKKTLPIQFPLGMCAKRKLLVATSLCFEFFAFMPGWQLPSCWLWAQTVLWAQKRLTASLRESYPALCLFLTPGVYMRPHGCFILLPAAPKAFGLPPSWTVFLLQFGPECLLWHPPDSLFPSYHLGVVELLWGLENKNSIAQWRLWYPKWEDWCPVKGWTGDSAIPSCCNISENV